MTGPLNTEFIKSELLKAAQITNHSVIGDSIAPTHILLAAAHRLGELVERSEHTKLIDQLQTNLGGAQTAIDQLTQECGVHEDRVKFFESLVQNLTLQSESWAQEARTQRTSLHECYQAVTGSTGEPGDWNGARPVKEKIEQLVSERLRLLHELELAADHIGYEGDWFGGEPIRQLIAEHRALKIDNAKLVEGNDGWREMNKEKTDELGSYERLVFDIKAVVTNLMESLPPYAAPEARGKRIENTLAEVMELLEKRKGEQGE